VSGGALAALGGPTVSVGPWATPPGTLSPADSVDAADDQAMRSDVPTGAAPLGRALGLQAPHGVPWLPEAPTVSQWPMDLYLWTPLANDQVEAWGLPCADLFLLAGQDPLRLADRRPTGYLLRVRVPAGAAVDLHEHTRHAPAAVQQRLVDTGNTHLLPLAWLRDMRVTGSTWTAPAASGRARTSAPASWRSGSRVPSTA
jgi:hypothetical protein